MADRDPRERARQISIEGRPDAGSLPEYDRPPVVETVLSVHFKGSRELSTIAMVEFWQQHLKADLPHVEERERYEPPIERFDQPSAMALGQFAFGIGAIPNRYWFSSANGAHLVQLQSDWFAFNWRKTAGGKYERYRSGLRNFNHYWSQLLEFSKRQGFEDFKALQCEVTYVNHIVAGEGWLTHADLGAVLRIIDTADFVGHRAESQAWNSRYLINDGESPVGRLHINCEPAYTKGVEPVPMFVLTLTARGKPADSSPEGISAFFEKGHESIVSTFDDLTTDRMHEIWGRKANS